MSITTLKVIKNNVLKKITGVSGLPIEDMQISLANEGILFKTKHKAIVAAGNSLLIHVTTPTIPVQHRSIRRRLKVQGGGPLTLAIYRDPTDVVDDVNMSILNMNGNSLISAKTAFKVLASATYSDLFDEDFIPVAQGIATSIGITIDTSILGRIIALGAHEFIVEITNDHATESAIIYYEYMWYEPQN